MDFPVKDIVFPIMGGIASILGWAFLTFLQKLEKNFDKLTDSVERLNVNVAVLVQQVPALERRVERLELDKGE